MHRLAAPRIDVQSSSPERQPQPKAPLPYPDENPDIHMPNHETFIQQADFASSFGPRSPSWSPPTAATAPTVVAMPSIPRPKPSPQPDMSSRHSLPEALSKAPPIPDPEPVMDVPTTLPPCPRSKWSTKYDDWYTLKGDPSFDICPNCLDQIVWPTAFRDHFTRAPAQPSSVRTRCDFASPWTRLAWLLTLKRRRPDLDLIYALSAINLGQSECADMAGSTGPWYGLLDPSGHFIPNFAICPCDVKYVVALFPSFDGSFTLLPPVSGGGSRQARQCSLRISSRRYPTYLDLLVAIDDEARRSPNPAPPNLKTLIDVLRVHAYKPECPRDHLTVDTPWHYIPTFPDTTVCEECYDELVWPSIKAGSSVAERFSRVLMPLPPSNDKKGATCQLYSPRMRRVWERAVKYGDEEGLKYLTRKVKERKDVEEDVRKQQVEISNMLDRTKGSSVDRDRLRRELKRLEMEWEDWE